MRNIIGLNGTWDFAPMYDVISDISLPEVAEYSQITVPSVWTGRRCAGRDFYPFDIMEHPAQWSEADTGVYRRSVSVSKDPKERIFLHMENVGQRAGIYINAAFVCEWIESFLPLHRDVTEFLHDGENELCIVCSSQQTTVLPSGEVKTLGLVGSWFGCMARGIWGDIWLETVPTVHIQDVVVRTSVRKKNLEIITELSENCPDAQITACVYDGDTCVLSVQGEPGSFSVPWEDPILWMPDNPKLYELRVCYYQSGSIVDEKTVRFGFREFWNEGPQFVLNGTPINLRGDSWHFQGNLQMTKEYARNWFTLCKNSGLNYIRLHAEPHPSYYLDVADEVGMMIVDETAIYGSSKTMDAGDEIYIKNCYTHTERLVRRDRNHPCIIFWSLQNEMRWVEGRDVYKTHIPLLMQMVKKLDPTREVSIDGDNRLLSYADTVYESYHYNIDGTLAQWRREKPLTVGEHGSMWYINPHNAGAFTGLKAYHGFEESAIGVAKKEAYFVEEARRKGVSGISTFNFAYYYTYAMPDEDVYLADAPFRKIPKYALSINNGYLKDYPVVRPNPVMGFMKEIFREVTVINREYNQSFFDDQPIVRSFDVYNDTLHTQNTKIAYTYSVDGKQYLSHQEAFTQQPAQTKLLQVELPQIPVDGQKNACLQIQIFHDDARIMERTFTYKLYPSAWKTESLPLRKPVFYYGGDRCFDRITHLCDAVRVHDLSSLDPDSILILGNHLTDDPNSLQKPLEQYTAAGGSVIVLEQSTFALGDLCLQGLDFISAHADDYSHPVLQGLCDADLMFWAPLAEEGVPAPVCRHGYLKPQSGEYRFLLVSSAGDFADGGYLWSPLMTQSCGKGTVLLCQMDIDRFYDTAPQACILLRNLISYADSLSAPRYQKVGAVGKTAAEFLSGTNVCFDLYKGDITHYDILVADVLEADTQWLQDFVKAGGTLVTLPCDQQAQTALSQLLEQPVAIEVREVSHLEKASPAAVMQGISVVDLYRYDKVMMSPRPVVNRRIAVNTVEVENATELLHDVPGTPWEDYYWNNLIEEHLLIPQVSQNRENVPPRKCFMAQADLGKGKVILSQLKAESADEKDVRIYTRLLENLGAQTHTKLFAHKRTGWDYAVDFFMTIDYKPWKDFELCKAYFTDPAYTLNNLGEGVYGWMKKVEKDRRTGFVCVPDSAGKVTFSTCFARKDSPEAVQVRLDANCSTELYINGQLVTGQTVQLQAGENTIALISRAEAEDLKYRLVFLKQDETALPDLRIHLTIDEVDPK